MHAIASLIISLYKLPRHLVAARLIIVDVALRFGWAVVPAVLHCRSNGLLQLKKIVMHVGPQYDIAPNVQLPVVFGLNAHIRRVNVDG